MKNKLKTSGENSPIISNSNINVFYQVKLESVMFRKNQLYIPLIEELDNIIQICNKGNLLVSIKYDFIKEVVQKQYKHRLDDLLLRKIQRIDDAIQSYNKINAINICGNIIVNAFTQGFIELYGDINDGEAPIYHEGYIVDYETIYPEEYDLIRMIAYDAKLVEGIINKFEEFIEYDNELYNKYLITMYEFALADRNKKYSPKRHPIIEWDDKPEYFIASLSNIDELFDKDKDISSKRNILREIIKLSEELIADIDQILKEIFERYEKE